MFRLFEICAETISGRVLSNDTSDVKIDEREGSNSGLHADIFSSSDSPIEPLRVRSRKSYIGEMKTDMSTDLSSGFHPKYSVSSETFKRTSLVSGTQICSSFSLDYI